jgi:hypothetical protein
MPARINVRNIYIYLYNVKFKQCLDLPSRDLDGHALPRPSPVRAPIKLLIAITAPYSKRLDAGKNANDVQRVAGTALLFYLFR